MSVNSLDKHGNSHQRRRLLCIFLLFVSPILLTACQVTQPTPTPTLSTTHTTTATSTATHTPTITPSPAPTETATITPTPTPLVIAKPWEISREDQDKTLAQLMFPFIGGINHINRHGIDLRYGDLNIAFIHDSQIDPSKDVQNLRETYAGKLNQDPQLLDQLASISAQLEGIANVTVVIENGQITQVATKPYQTITRYVLESDSILREMTAEEEPQLLPELVVDGPYIKRADTNESIVFKGIALYPYDAGTRSTLYNYVVSNIEANENLGIHPNIVKLCIDIDSLSKQDSIEDLIKITRYLEAKGIFLIPYPVTPKDKIDFPNERVIDAMIILSSNLNNFNNVLYQPWGEPGSIGSRDATWSDWIPWITKLTDPILENYNNKNKPIIILSGIKWARDLTQMPQNWNFPFIFDVHDYRWDGSDIRHWWLSNIGKIPIIIGEIGGFNPTRPNQTPYQSEGDIEYIQETLSKIVNDPNNKDMIHYTIWRGENSGDGIRTNFNTLTKRGEIYKNEMTNNPTQTDLTK